MVEIQPALNVDWVQATWPPRFRKVEPSVFMLFTIERASGISSAAPGLRHLFCMLITTSAVRIGVMMSKTRSCRAAGYRLAGFPPLFRSIHHASPCRRKQPCRPHSGHHVGFHGRWRPTAPLPSHRLEAS